MSYDEQPALLTGWGRTAPTLATVWRPRDAEEVRRRVPTFRHGSTVVARGLGRSYGDAAQNAGGRVLLGTTLDRVLELDLDKGTVTCEAGMSLDLLMRLIIPLGWFPTVIPGTRHVTVGGAIASDAHGKLRHGSFCDFVARATLVTPDGRAHVVSAADNPELFWATAGGMGLTGIVTDATLRLHRIETARMTVDTERCADVDTCMARMLDSDGDYRYSVAWIDCLARGRNLGRSVLERGNHTTLDELRASRVGRRHPDRSPLHYAPTRQIPAPPWAPTWLLNSLSIAAFNELWFRKAPRRERGAIHSIEGFFHPLDAVVGWNRIYGRHGFVQYQMVVPYGEERVVRAVLERLSASRTASFLAVLKRFERANDGFLSFPMPGWTLALDLPAVRSGLAEILDDLDRLVVNGGGRIYLAKDARVAPDIFTAMYPRLDEWRAVQASVDPHRVLRSDLSRRLSLLGARGGA
jgi:decaprenylphospho-beta-D-ribofuranose 2-oxidase